MLGKVTRPYRKLTTRESGILIKRMRMMVAGKPKPSQYLASVLGCSLRTARRLLNSGEDGPLLRRVYAQSMANILGISIRKLFAERPIDSGDIVSGWNTNQRTDEARATAGKLGMTIANLAQVGYGLLANFAVNHSIDGRPSMVVVELVTGITKNHLIWHSTDARGYTAVIVKDKDGATIYDARPSWKVVHETLKKISNDRKNSTTVTRRDVAFTQPPPNSRG